MKSWALPKADTYFEPVLAQDPRGFEIDHLELALTHCTQFRTAVDGGAHVGTWSAALAKRFMKVLAFEPAPDTFACLSGNLFDARNVDLFRLALGEERRLARIVDDPTRKGNTGARHLDVARAGETEIIPLDDMHLIDLDFLKLDVEGYELHALQGAIDTLKRCRPVVLIEAKRFHPERFGVDVEAATRFLKTMGFHQVASAKNDRVFCP